MEKIQLSYNNIINKLPTYKSSVNDNIITNKTNSNTTLLTKKIRNILNKLGYLIFGLWMILIIALTVTGGVYYNKTDYINIKDSRKYKDLPISTCFGNTNITNIWYSPPYPFNNSPTYSPATMTFNTFALNNFGNLTPVYGRVPTLFDYITHNSDLCDIDSICDRFHSETVLTMFFYFYKYYKN